MIIASKKKKPLYVKYIVKYLWVKLFTLKDYSFNKD